MAAGDAVPRNRPGDEARRVAKLEQNLQEAVSALQSQAVVLASLLVPGTATSSATNVGIPVAVAGDGAPALTVTSTVPPGMTRLLLDMTGWASAVNGTTGAEPLSIQCRVTDAVGNVTTSAKQTTTVPAGTSEQVSGGLRLLMVNLNPGDVLTHQLLVFTAGTAWPANAATVLDLQATLLWLA